MSWCDVHCHLADERMAHTLPAIMERAARAGVGWCVCSGVRALEWPLVAALARQYPRRIVPSFGVHPWFVATAGARWHDELEAALEASRAAVGEIGLDFAVDNCDRSLQEHFFRAQLEIAARRSLPVTIHCRRAWGRLVAILQEHPLRAGGLVHSWSGSAELVPVLEKMGLCISFSGSLTRPAARKVHAAVKAVSDAGLLIETDSPDIVPHGCPSPLNEPANLPLIAEQAALLRGCRVAQLEEMTAANSHRLFGALRTPFVSPAC